MKNLFKALVAVCAISVTSGVSASLIALDGQYIFREVRGAEYDLGSGLELTPERSVFQIGAFLLDESGPILLTDAEVMLRANLIGGGTETFALTSTSGFYEDVQPFSTALAYWATYVEVSPELVDASWTISATHEGHVATPLELPSWSDAVTNLAPALDPSASFISTPEILDIELTQSGPRFTYSLESSLSNYDGEVDQIRTVLRSCANTGRCESFEEGSKLIAREQNLDMGATSYDYTLPSPLDYGTYGLALDVRDRLGTFGDTFFVNSARTNVRFRVESVPEPTTTALLALGLIGAGLGFPRRRISSSL